MAGDFSKRVAHGAPACRAGSGVPRVQKSVAGAEQHGEIAMARRQSERDRQSRPQPSRGQQVRKISGHHFVPVRNRARENLLRIVAHPPAQIECRRAVPVGHFQRQPHPLPKFTAVGAAKIIVRQGPARFELTIDAGGCEQPSLRAAEIAAYFRRQSEPDAGNRSERIERSDAFQQRCRILAAVFHLERPEREVFRVARHEIGSARHRIGRLLAKKRVGLRQAHG